MWITNERRLFSGFSCESLMKDGCSAGFHVNQVLHHVVPVAISLDTDDLPITGLYLRVAILVQHQVWENLVSLCVYLDFVIFVENPLKCRNYKREIQKILTFYLLWHNEAYSRFSRHGVSNPMHAKNHNFEGIWIFIVQWSFPVSVASYM